MKLILLVALIAFAIWYAGFLRGLIDGGSWYWLSLMFVWPFVLAYIVGDEADRADFHRIRDWIIEKLRLR